MSSKIKNLTVTAMFFALSIAFCTLENLIPPIPTLPPGIKLGLSNIPVMYFLFFGKRYNAFVLAILKSLFVLITKGFTASLLSFSGGIASVCIMCILMLIFKEKISYTILSVTGAIFHNIAQILIVSFIYGVFLWTYLPILIISGMVAGIATSAVLKVTLNAVKKL